MAKVEVKLESASRQHDFMDGEDVSIDATGTVEVRTPSGQVFVSHDSTANMTLVVIRGEKGTFVAKFNEKAVV